MKLLVTIKPEHFSWDRCLWGDVSNNPVSFAIAAALGTPNRPVYIRLGRRTLAPLHCMPIAVPDLIEFLFDQWVDEKLPVNHQFEINIPPEWITK